MPFGIEQICAHYILNKNINTPPDVLWILFYMLYFDRRQILQHDKDIYANDPDVCYTLIQAQYNVWQQFD
jgi:hypothetical protein